MAWNRKIAVLPGIVAVLLAASFIAYQKRDVIYGELNALKLIPIPERFTELYFENSSSLPRKTVAGQPISFSFTIHNVEGTTTTYPYSVYFKYPNGAQISFANSNVILAADASTSIKVTYIFPTSNLAGIVVVNLTQLNQQIDFLLSGTNP